MWKLFLPLILGLTFGEPAHAQYSATVSKTQGATDAGDSYPCAGSGPFELNSVPNWESKVQRPQHVKDISNAIQDFDTMEQDAEAQASMYQKTYNSTQATDNNTTAGAATQGDQTANVSSGDMNTAAGVDASGTQQNIETTGQNMGNAAGPGGYQTCQAVASPQAKSALTFANQATDCSGNANTIASQMAKQNAPQQDINQVAAIASRFLGLATKANALAGQFTALASKCGGEMQFAQEIAANTAKIAATSMNQFQATPMVVGAQTASTIGAQIGQAAAAAFGGGSNGASNGDNSTPSNGSVGAAQQSQLMGQVASSNATPVSYSSDGGGSWAGNAASDPALNSQACSSGADDSAAQDIPLSLNPYAANGVALMSAPPPATLGGSADETASGQGQSGSTSPYAGSVNMNAAIAATQNMINDIKNLPSLAQTAASAFGDSLADSARAALKQAAVDVQSVGAKTVAALNLISYGNAHATDPSYVPPEGSDESNQFKAAATELGLDGNSVPHVVTVTANIDANVLNPGATLASGSALPQYAGWSKEIGLACDDKGMCQFTYGGPSKIQNISANPIDPKTTATLAMQAIGGLLSPKTIESAFRGGGLQHAIGGITWSGKLGFSSAPNAATAVNANGSSSSSQIGWYIAGRGVANGNVMTPNGTEIVGADGKPVSGNFNTFEVGVTPNLTFFSHTAPTENSSSAIGKPFYIPWLVDQK